MIKLKQLQQLDEQEQIRQSSQVVAMDQPHQQRVHGNDNGKEVKPSILSKHQIQPPSFLSTSTVHPILHDISVNTLHTVTPHETTRSNSQKGSHRSVSIDVAKRRSQEKGTTQSRYVYTYKTAAQFTINNDKDKLAVDSSETRTRRTERKGRFGAVHNQAFVTSV